MNMFLVLALAVCVASADRLQSSYLPPVSAKTAGGSGLLAPPVASFSSSSANAYSAPSGQHNARTYTGQSGAPVAILRFDNDNAGDGTYRFQYETENRISQEESGEVKNAGTDQEATVVRGSYSYTAPDGVTYTVNYVADENGFRASGDHLPTPPPVPPVIQRSLGSNARSGYSGADPSRQYLSPQAAQRSAGYQY